MVIAPAWAINRCVTRPGVTRDDSLWRTNKSVERETSSSKRRKSTLAILTWIQFEAKRWDSDNIFGWSYYVKGKNLGNFRCGYFIFSLVRSGSLMKLMMDQLNHNLKYIYDVILFLIQNSTQSPKFLVFNDRPASFTQKFTVPTTRLLENSKWKILAAWLIEWSLPLRSRRCTGWINSSRRRHLNHLVKANEQHGAMGI